MDLNLSEEQRGVRRAAAEFAREEIAPRAARIDATNTFDRELFRRMGEMGFLGLMAPEEYGGSAAGNLAWCLMVEEVAQAAAFAANFLVNTRSTQGLILELGDAEQRRSLLPDMVAGNLIMAFALTEPGAGSDAVSLQTTARLAGDEYVLNGQKQFITLGGVADCIAVTATLDRAARSKGIRVFLVPRLASGFSAAPKEELLGLRGMGTTALFFHDCRIPQRNIVGPDASGFGAFMRALDGGRLGIAASAVGQAQAARDAALSYAKERRQFGKPIAEMQAIEAMLVDMECEIEAARLLTWKAAWRRDSGLSHAVESSVAKLFASEVCMRTTLNAMQIFGGYSYSKEYPVERYFRDAKIHEIWDGTSQIQRMIIGRHLRAG